MPRTSPPSNNSRNLCAFGWTALFNDTATEMAYWVLPAFLSSIGAGPAQLGVIEGVAESVASFVQLFSGYLAERSMPKTRALPQFCQCWRFPRSQLTRAKLPPHAAVRD